MSAVAGIIRKKQIVLPNGCLDAFEGRNVLVTILDSSPQKSTEQSMTHDVAVTTDPFDSYVGGWQSFNNDIPVATMVATMREGRTFDT